MKPVAKINGLKAYYITDSPSGKGYIRAVDDVSLSLNEDEIIGVSGESGCGKSTLIKVLYGLVKPPLAIVDGSVDYNLQSGKTSLLSLDRVALNKMHWKVLSYIPQASMSVLNPTIKIRSEFLDVIQTHQKDTDRRETKELMERHIDKLGLPREVLTSYPHQLSGGMRQRVVIALSTLLKPSVLFADEPTTALDVIVQRGVIQLLSTIQRELRNTLVLVTHDMGVHAQIAQRVVIMYAGKIMEVAATEKMFRNPYHPYTRYLIDSLPRVGDKSKRSSIGGRPPSLRDPPEGCRFHPRCPHAKESCKKEIPHLTEVSTGHWVACHLQEMK